MASIRVGQVNSEGYNPDGMPGTVTTGVPGPAPTSDQVLTAVSQYLSVNPPTVAPTTPTASVHNKFGAGATGQPGSYVDVAALTDAFISVGGSLPNANLTVSALGTGSVNVLSPLVANAGLQVFGSWTLTGPSVQIQSVGTGSTATVDVTNGSGTYLAVRASAFTVTSDRSLKNSISPLSGALAEVLTTPVYSYRMNEQWHRGLIADEAPLGVRHDGAEVAMLDLYSLIATLWQALYELNEQMQEMGRCSRFQPTS